MVSIELPKPERSPLCQSIHFLYNPNDGLANYYTVECSMEEGKHYLCEWTRDENHVNYGLVNAPDKARPDYGLMVAVQGHAILKLAGRKEKGIALDDK